jgi:hypothetical protein
MNHIYNDYGEYVIAIGMENSDADILNRYPKLIKRLKELKNSHAYLDEFYKEIRIAGIDESMKFGRQNYIGYRLIQLAYKDDLYDKDVILNFRGEIIGISEE